jgi:hypothetical protein
LRKRIFSARALKSALHWAVSHGGALGVALGLGEGCLGRVEEGGELRNLLGGYAPGGGVVPGGLMTESQFRAMVSCSVREWGNQSLMIFLLFCRLSGGFNRIRTRSVGAVKEVPVSAGVCRPGGGALARSGPRFGPVLPQRPAPADKKEPDGNSNGAARLAILGI